MNPANDATVTIGPATEGDVRTFVREGLAVSERDYSHPYRVQERRARAERRGLWR